MKEKIEYIKKIDNDDNLYRSILNEQLFIDDNLSEANKREKCGFFKNIFEQEKNKAKRIDKYQTNLSNI